MKTIFGSWFRLILVLLAVGWPQVTQAVTAPGQPFSLDQPDGTRFEARARGDEFFSWFETMTGYPIDRDPVTGVWFYMDPAKNGVGPDRLTHLEAQGEPPPGGPWSPVKIEPDEPPPPEDMAAFHAPFVPLPKDFGIFPKVPVPSSAGEIAAPPPDAPSFGVGQIATLCLKFSDMAAQPTTPPSVFQTRLFDETPGALSMTNYFWLNSYQQFRVRGGPSGVAGWLTLPNTRASYAAQHPTNSEIKDVNRPGFVNDAVSAADATGFDFGPYDTDNDGFVDCLVLIAQGMGQEGTGGPDAFWAHQGEIPQKLTNDVNAQGEPVYVSRYFVVSELLQIPDNPATTDVDETAPTPQTIGVIAHEYGHALGLPDLYDRTGGTTTTSSGLGQWSLMGSGNWLGTGVIGSRPAWLDAWCRKKLGWAVVQNVTQNTLQMEIPSAQSSPVIYRLWTNGNLGSQYFLVENRPATGFDQFLPGGTGGLLIYHVDDSMAESQNDDAWWYLGPGTGNSRTNNGHYQVALEQADGLFNLERLGSNSNPGDKDDPWTSAKDFNGSSVPSSRKYNTGSTTGEGDETFVEVRNISAPDTNRAIKADFIIANNLFAVTTITMPEEPIGEEPRVYQTMEQFEGTAFDGDAGSNVWEVQVYLREDKPDGRFWKFTTHEWQSSYSEQEQKGVAAGTGGLNWARLMDDPALSDGVYEVKARSEDITGLVGPFVTRKFRIQRDMTAPDIIISSPGTSPLSAVPVMSGSAIDNVAIQSKQFSLYSHTQGKWLKWSTGQLNSGTFSAVDHILPQNDSTSPWSVTLPALLPNGDYQFFAETTDTTNQSSGWKHMYFTLQVTPKVALTQPQHGGFLNSAPALIGTAQAGAGATLVSDRVTLTIERDGQWWDGDSWVGSSFEVHANVSGGDWAYPANSVDPVAVLPADDGLYTVTVTATDSLGRVSQPVLAGLPGNTTVSYTVDTVPPALEIASPLADTVISGPPVLSNMLHGSTHDSSGRPEVKLLLKRLTDGKYWSGVNWFADSAQALVPGGFGGDDLGSQTAWEWSVRMPRLGIREGNMTNGGYELTAVARDIAGNETTKTRAFTVNWNPVWMRPQYALAQLQPAQTPPISGGAVGSNVHQTYSPRFGPSDNSRSIAPITFGLDASGNTYVVSGSNSVLGYNTGSVSTGIFQRLGAGGWRRERQISTAAGPGPEQPVLYFESWDGVSQTQISSETGAVAANFQRGAVDAAGNTYGTYILADPVFIGFSQILVVKFDSGGNLLWRSVLNRPVSGVSMILPTPDGGAYLVPQHAYLQSIEYGFSMQEVVKISPGGSFGPVVVHGQLDGGDYDPAVWATHLLSEVDPAGNLFIATSEDVIGGTGAVQVLRKYNAAGEELAKLEVDPGETPEQWLTMKTDAAGDVYVASMFDVTETDRRVCLTRYNSSLQLQWRAFGPPNSLSYNPVTAWMPQMHIGPHGITLAYGSPGQGYYSEFPYEHGQITRFSASGDLLWTRGIKGSQPTVQHGDAIHSFQVDTAGNVLFLAAFNEPFSLSDFHYGKLTAAGDLQFITETGGLASFFPITTTALYQGTQLLTLDQGYNNAPPPDDTYDLVLFDNPANQLVPVTLDSDQPADQTVIAGADVRLRVINRGSSATYQWRKNDGLGVPQDIPGATTDSLRFTAVTLADAGEYSVVVTNAVDSATSRTATLTVLQPVSLDIALDSPGRTWTTGGDLPWAGYSPAPSHDAVDAAMPGNITNGQTSWVETTVTGPAVVSFWWKASTQMFGDTLDFSVDGGSVSLIHGEQDWTNVTHNLGEGSHTLRWTFQKDSDLSDGADRVWLDQVAISTAMPLAEALDTTGLTWTTTADALAWTGVASPSHDGVDSAVSGTTGGNQQSWVETTVSGPGSLTFWWKVSSEDGFDFLNFTVDGAPSGSITGEVNWTQVTSPISAGTHVIRWSYEKDPVFSAGQDRAWLDEVVFTPAGAPEIVVEQPALNGLIDDASTVDFGTALPGNNTVRTFTIRNTGNAQLNGLVVTRNGTNDTDFALGSLGQNSLNPGDFTTFTVTFTPGASDARTAALHIQSNDADENTFDINLMGSGGVPVTSWRQQHFLTTANTGDAADDADPDHDGKSNLLEFATGTGPNTTGSATENIEPPEGGLVEFLYTRNKLAMAELTFQVEWADNLLGPWSSVGVVETILSDNGLIQQVRATFPAGTSGRRFAWLKVTRP